MTEGHSEGRGEVDLCVDYTLFTNVPETCHPFFIAFRQLYKFKGVARHPTISVRLRTCVGPNDTPIGFHIDHVPASRGSIFQSFD